METRDGSAFSFHCRRVEREGEKLTAKSLMRLGRHRSRRVCISSGMVPREGKLLRFLPEKQSRNCKGKGGRGRSATPKKRRDRDQGTTNPREVDNTERNSILSAELSQRLSNLIGGHVPGSLEPNIGELGLLLLDEASLGVGVEVGGGSRGERSGNLSAGAAEER